MKTAKVYDTCGALPAAWFLCVFQHAVDVKHQRERRCGGSPCQVSVPHLSFSARRPRPCGLGMKGAPARRVGDCRPTGGPAESYACGAEPLPTAPTNVSDGHGRVPLSGSPCSAQEEADIPATHRKREVRRPNSSYD